MPGPYVQAALICEKALSEADGTLSLIRVIDRVIVTAQGTDLPQELPAGGMIGGSLVVMLKADDARGRYPIKIRAQTPAGTYLDDQTVDATFEGEERGVNLIIQLGIEAVEGLYWFEVYINETTLLTKIPLRVSYQRVGR